MNARAARLLALKDELDVLQLRVTGLEATAERLAKDADKLVRDTDKAAHDYKATIAVVKQELAEADHAQH